MNATDPLRRLRELLRILSVKKGRFVLASGELSDVYIDCRRTTLHPEGAWLTGRAVLDRLRREGWSAGAIGGPTLGADPIATAVAVASWLDGAPLPAFLVRKAAKDHGTGQRIEGCPPAGTRVVLVEDTVTSGGSLLAAARACREAGLEPAGVIALVDREAGAREAFAREGLPFAPLFTAAELL